MDPAPPSRHAGDEDTRVAETPSLFALDDWNNWPQDHPSYIPLFDAARSTMFCRCRLPKCRRCNQKRQVLHVSQYTTGGRELMDEKITTLQLHDLLEKWNQVQREGRCRETTQHHSLRLFFLCDDDASELSLCGYMQRVLAYLQTPSCFVLRKRLNEVVPTVQIANEPRTNIPSAETYPMDNQAGPSAASSGSTAQRKMLHILVQLTSDMLATDFKSHSQYLSAGRAARGKGKQFLRTDTFIYLRYDYYNRECTIVTAGNSSAFHCLRQSCASPNSASAIGSEDPFAFVVAYIAQLLLHMQNVERELQAGLHGKLKDFGKISVDTEHAGMFKEMNYKSASIPRMVKDTGTILRALEELKEEHDSFLKARSSGAPPVAPDAVCVVRDRLKAQLQLASDLESSFLCLATSYQRLSESFIGFALIQNGSNTYRISIDSQKQLAATEALARDARRDNATMKMITVVTLVYLPPTFVCTMLGMGMFDFADDRIHVARGGWVLFVVISLPLTALTLGLAYLWKQSKERQWDREAAAEHGVGTLPAPQQNGPENADAPTTAQASYTDAARASPAPAHAASAAAPASASIKARITGLLHLRRRRPPPSDLEAAKPSG